MLTGVTGSSRPGGSGASGYQTHVDGTLMLLRLRGEEQFTRPEGRHLYSTLLSAMVHILILALKIIQLTVTALAAPLRQRRADPRVPRARIPNLKSHTSSSSLAEAARILPRHMQAPGTDQELPLHATTTKRQHQPTEDRGHLPPRRHAPGRQDAGLVRHPRVAAAESPPGKQPVTIPNTIP